jgi:hypothetical protein
LKKVSSLSFGIKDHRSLVCSRFDSNQWILAPTQSVGIVRSTGPSTFLKFAIALISPNPVFDDLVERLSYQISLQMLNRIEQQGTPHLFSVLRNLT